VSIDPIGVVFVSSALLVSLYAVRVTFHLFRDLGTHFFRCAVCACAGVTVMISGYIFPAVLNSPSYQQMVQIGQLLLASFGVLAIAFIIEAIEYVKYEPNESLINAGFILVGGLISSRLFPGQYLVLWTGTGWQQQYGLVVAGLSVALFIFLLAELGPIVYRVWHRIRKPRKNWTYSQMLFLAFTFLFAFYGAYMISVNTLEIQLLPSSANYYLFLLLIAGFTGTVSKLFDLYPTVFFAVSHDIYEIQFVSKETQRTVYSYRFQSENLETDPLSIPIAHDSIKQVFHDTLEQKGEVQSIRVENSEILAAEGDSLYGLLLTKRGSDLLRGLLLQAVRHFEREYSVSEVYLGGDFDNTIENYFQFAIHSEHHANTRQESGS
jgi:hypothetical protein